IIALVLSAVIVYFTKVYGNIMYILITFSSVFAILANLQILADSFKGKWRLAGSAVSHIGFGLLLIGALIAAATNEVISVNSSNYIAVAGFDQVEKPGENLFLTEGEPVQMGEYKITYVGDSVAAPNVFYKINYERIDEETGAVKESFVLMPFAQNNPQMGGLIGTPGTKHFLTHDIYTLITAALNQEQDASQPSTFYDYKEPATYEVNIGNTLRYRNGYYIIDAINKNATISNIPKEEGDVLVGMQIRVVASDGKEFKAEPIF